MLGNNIDVEILISNINKNTNNASNLNNETGNTQDTDITTAKDILPKAGESKIIILAVMIALISLAGVFYVKIRKYRDVK